MLQGPAQTAQSRLAALAARRHAQAGKIGSMPVALRERLHEEIRRRADGGAAAGVPEPVPRSALAEAWSRWRAVVSLACVGLGAVVVLSWVVRSGIQGRSTTPGSLASATTRSESSREALAVPLGGATEAGPAAASAAARSTDPSTSASVVIGASEAPAATPAAADAADAAGAVVRGPSGVVRLRRLYLAPDPEGTATEGDMLLRRFDVVRVRDRLEFRDQDGSVYVGRVQSVPASGATNASRLWVYEGRGVQVGSGKVVQITGQFGPVPESGEGEGEDDVMMNSPFSGNAAIGEGRVVEVKARPEP